MSNLGPGAAPYFRAKPPTWLWAVPLFSCGLLGFVPPLVIATKLKTVRAWQWAAGFAIVDLVGLTVVGMQPDDVQTTGSTVGVVLVLAAGVGSVFYGQIVGQKVDWSPQVAVYTPPPFDPNPGAVAAVVAQRQNRTQARELARRDPQMARDLRIGRPDLPRHYDDGGLIDVNAAPVEAIAAGLALTSTQAARIVETRQRIGRFEHPEDLLNLAELELDAFEQARDRVVII